MLIIDHIDAVKIEKERFFNELVYLQTLWEGLELLNHHTRRVEVAVCPDATKVRVVSWGNMPELDPRTLRHLSCFFDWYSVSACNYVRMIGWLARESGATRDLPAAYLKRIIPAVLTHRHKVAAHPSRNWPKDDPPALQEASAMWKLARIDDRFTVHTLVFRRTAGGSSSDSSDLAPWSLTKIHEELRNRYHPPQNSADEDSGGMRQQSQ